MSLGAQKRTSASESHPRAVIPGDLTGIRSQVNSLFGNQIKQLGGGFGTTPAGPVGQAYQAFFDRNPLTDFLGAETAIRNALSGDTFTSGFNQAFSALEPGLRRNIDILKTSVLDQASPLGLRFSSDVLNQQRRGAQELLLGTQNQAANLGLNLLGQQLQGGLGVFGLTQQAALDQLARQLPLLVQYATSFAPVGQVSGSRARGSGFDIGLPISPIKVGG
ncbi:MAG: hypothetical protein D6812_02145 [Deltaproteobacteria bacterium]|nr:MAG: hypothetical protein D6812_02145 [Deltaproteobacteria bacterium]